MKSLLTADVISKGSRSGSVHSPDGLMNSNPLVPEPGPRGPCPEHLFAGAYAACYHGALIKATGASGLAAVDSTVRTRVNLNEDEHGGVHLAVVLYVLMPGIAPAQATQIMAEAHRTCPYSKALRGDASVRLESDEVRQITP